MGRYYGGDIAGKFWFGIQSSDDAKHFGVEPTEQEKVYSGCERETYMPVGHVCENCDQTCELQHTSEHPVRLGERDTVNVKQSQGWLSSQTMLSGDNVRSNQLCWLESQALPYGESVATRMSGCDNEYECKVIYKNEIQFHFTNHHTLRVHHTLYTLSQQLLQLTPAFAEVLNQVEKDTEWKEDAYNDNTWVSEDIDSVVTEVGKKLTNSNDEEEYNKLAARYLLGVQIYRCLFVKDSCSFWCEL